MRGTPICDSFLLVGRDESNVVVNFNYGITSSSSWSFLYVILKHASLELQGPVKTCALFQRWPPWACTYKHAHTYHTYLCASSAHSSHFMRNWGKVISWPRGSFSPHHIGYTLGSKPKELRNEVNILAKSKIWNPWSLQLGLGTSFEKIEVALTWHHILIKFRQPPLKKFSS